MSTQEQIPEGQVRSAKTAGWLFLLVSVVALMIGIGGFGSASSGDVEMFGVTMEAKYACFIYFVLGALFLWSAIEARKRGFK